MVNTKGKRKVVVVPEVGEPIEYSVSKRRYLTVQENDRVRSGDALMDGPANPHDILRVKGEKALGPILWMKSRKFTDSRAFVSTTSTSRRLFVRCCVACALRMLEIPASW